MKAWAVAGLVAGLLVAVPAGPAQAQPGWTWTTLSYGEPVNGELGLATHAYGVSADKVVGRYSNTRDDYGFVYDGRTYSLLASPWATDAMGIFALGVSGNRVAGYYRDNGYQSQSHGFLYDGTSWSTMDYPGAVATWASGFDGNSVFGGYSTASGERHLFLYDSGVWTSVDYPSVPGSSDTQVADMSDGRILGSFRDSSGVWRGFLLEDTEYTTLEFPGATLTSPTGIWGDRIVGTYYDGLGTHGFLYDGQNWTSLDYPGAGFDGKAWTQVWDIWGDRIVGACVVESVGHAFLLTVPEPGSLGLLVLAGSMCLRRCGARGGSRSVRTPAGR